MGFGNQALGSVPYGGSGSAEYGGVILPIDYKKRYLYKIYDSEGNFITTWADVSNEPSFSEALGEGISELTVDLGRLESEYDESVSVAFGNILKIYCFDRESAVDTDGLLIYTGELKSYVPTVSFGKEVLRITFFPLWAQTAEMLLEDAGATEVVYSAQDPTDILKDLLDKFTANGGRIDYDGSSTEDTGESVDYTFNTTTYQEALKKVLELSPSNFYFRITPDNIVEFKARSEEADHKLTLGQNIIEYTPEKRTENIINTIYFIGGGDPKFYAKYVASGSVSAYGTKMMKYTDSRVLDTGSAVPIATRILDNLSEPEIRVTLKVMDNNGDAYMNGKGYDIESIKIGDMVQIENATSKGNNLWDVSVFDVSAWDYDITNASAIPLQVVKRQYRPDYVIIELSNKQPNVLAKIEEINRRLLDSLSADNPSTPS